jgi:hypothetical protein
MFLGMFQKELSLPLGNNTKPALTVQYYEVNWYSIQGEFIPKQIEIWNVLYLVLHLKGYRNIILMGFRLGVELAVQTVTLRLRTSEGFRIMLSRSRLGMSWKFPKEQTYRNLT